MGQQVDVKSEPKRKKKGKVKAKLNKLKKYFISDPKSSELIMNKLKVT